MKRELTPFFSRDVAKNALERSAKLARATRDEILAAAGAIKPAARLMNARKNVNEIDALKKYLINEFDRYDGKAAKEDLEAYEDAVLVLNILTSRLIEDVRSAEFEHL